MNFLILILTLLFSGLTYGQSFQMQYQYNSANEIQLMTTYKGPKAEIIIPTRGRIVSISQQSNISVTGGRIRIEENNTENTESTESTETGQEYTIRFTYSLLVPNQTGYGSISEDWYPTIIDMTNIEYSITSLTTPSGFLVYPYSNNENNTFSFTDTLQAKLAVFNYTTETSQDTSIPVTLYTANNFEIKPTNIVNIYEYLKEYFGDKYIDEIIVINTGLIHQNSFINDNKLYVMMSGRGTQTQIQNAMISVWSDKQNLSTRIFNMFKDSVLRLSKLNLGTDTVSTTPKETTETDTEQTINTDTEQTNTVPINSNTTTSIETDPGKLVLVPPHSYYKDLIIKGFTNNEIQFINVNNILENYGLLHMAFYNIGSESLLAGIKAYFAENPQIQTNTTQEDLTETPNEEGEKEEISTSEPTEETLPLKLDSEYIDWGTITQNKLQEPLYSLYTKEVLAPQRSISHLTANKNIVTRNSLNIPDFNISDSEENIIDITWNDLRSIRIDINSGSYLLDPDRKVPQQVYLDSYYSFDPEEQQIRATILNIANRYKAPGEQNLRKHLDLISIPIEETNTFEIEPGNTVYVLISHILSNSTGILKSAIKESFFVVNETGDISYLATRVRL